MCVRHDHYHLLVVEDGQEPVQVLRLERHQDHHRVALVVQPWVSDRRLGVEEPHSGLAPNVGLIPSHWRIVQPEVQMKQPQSGRPFNTAPHRRESGAVMTRLVFSAAVSAILGQHFEKRPVTNKHVTGRRPLLRTTGIVKHGTSRKQWNRLNVCIETVSLQV